MNYRNLAQAIHFVESRMKEDGEVVHTDQWQAFDISDRPDAAMVEILNTSFTAPLFGEVLPYYRNQVQPHLPWADDHFLERVSGAPLNPGVEWANWPWSTHADQSRKDEMFNHNYMERYWPKMAGMVTKPTRTVSDFINEVPVGKVEWHKGIRNTYGDLGDVVDLLQHDPTTRQAYLPIWFPEDTGYWNKGRKPCTLGYHFILRKNKLHIRYDIRSCDLYRHFRDDVYMTVRLLLWMLETLRDRDSKPWDKVEPGTFTMNITSLHMFINDYRVMFKRNPHVEG